MKQTTKMSRAVGQLEKMFNTLNTDFYGGALPCPIITVQSSPRAWGHCTRAKIWRRKGETTYEMNISAELLDKEIEEILDTMLHEMIHLYCRQENIQECSRGGMYHNGKFKELAEKCLLVCERQGQYGWNTVGKNNDRLIEYALSKDWTEIMIGRGFTMSISDGGRNGIEGALSNGGKGSTGGKVPSSTRKYQCPHCKNSVRATKEVNIICGDCNVKMERA